MMTTRRRRSPSKKVSYGRLSRANTADHVAFIKSATVTGQPVLKLSIPGSYLRLRGQYLISYSMLLNPVPREPTYH